MHIFKESMGKPELARLTRPPARTGLKLWPVELGVEERKRSKLLCCLASLNVSAVYLFCLFGGAAAVGIPRAMSPVYIIPCISCRGYCLMHSTQLSSKKMISFSLKTL